MKERSVRQAQGRPSNEATRSTRSGQAKRRTGAETLRGRGRVGGFTGFTLVELLVVLFCLAVTVVLVLPVVSDRDSHRLRAAGRVLVADLELAQSQSMSSGDDPGGIVIDADGLGYRIAGRFPQGGMEPGYAVRYGTGGFASLAGVRVADHNLGEDRQLSFGAFGQPDRPPGSPTPASITLGCGDLRLIIEIDPITGDITVGRPRVAG